MLTELPKATGWTVSLGTYESCMYKIQTDKGVVFINTHTDDCDCLAEHPDDAKRVLEECNKLYMNNQVELPRARMISSLETQERKQSA